jgi:hypothetical protein
MTGAGPVRKRVETLNAIAILGLAVALKGRKSRRCGGLRTQQRTTRRSKKSNRNTPTTLKHVTI